MPELTPMKPKGAGHDAYTNRVRQDWAAVIKAHPERFDALLHKTITHEVAEADDPALFGNVNEQVSDIAYQDPVLVSAVESSGDDDAFMSSFDGDESMGYGETAMMIMRLSEFDVPEGSIVEFLVSLSDGEVQRQYWYVHHSTSLGSPAIGSIHYCIPCGDIEQITLPDISEPAPITAPITEPEPEATSTESNGALFSV